MRQMAAEASVAAVAVIVTAALLHLLSLDPLGMVAAPIITALLLPVPATFLWRLIVAVAVLFAANAVLAFAVNLAGLPFTPGVAFAADVVPWVVLWRFRRSRPQLGPISDPGDLVAIATGVGVMFLFGRPAVGAGSGQLLALLAGGEDNAAHLAIVNAIGIHMQYPAFNRAEMHLRLLDGNIDYPAAFHLNVAVARAAFDNALGGSSSARLVEVYFSAGLAIQGVWAASTVLAARAVAGARGAGAAGTVVIGLATVLLFAFGPPSATVRFGFQPQAAALWLVTFGLVVAAAEQLGGRPLTRLGLVIVATVGTAWSWYLVLPVMVCLGAGVLVAHPAAYLGRRRATIALLASGAAASAPPVALGLRAGAAAAINASGGAYSVHLGVVAVVVAGAGVLAVSRHFANARGRLVALATMAGTIAFSALLYVYQVRTSGAAGYYYQKSMYTLVMIGFIIGGALFLSGFSRLVDRPQPGLGGRFVPFLAALVAVWMVTAVVTTSNPGRLYLSGAARFPDAGLMHHLLASGSVEDRRSLVVWHASPITVYDYYASRFAAAFSLRESGARNQLIAASIGGEDTSALLSYVRASSADVRILTRDPQLASTLARDGFTPGEIARVKIEMVTEPAEYDRVTPSGDISILRVLRRLLKR